MKLKRTTAAILAGAAMASAGALYALSAGGIFSLIGGVNSGGGTMSSATRVQSYTIGQSVSAMSGATYAVTPGIIGITPTARLNTDDAHAFPTPFRPSRGHSRITFTALPAAVNINIYTISGELVHTMSKNNPADSLIWEPVVNAKGSNVASGVYVFIVSSPGVRKKTGKLVVIR